MKSFAAFAAAAASLGLATAAPAAVTLINGSFEANTNFDPVAGWTNEFPNGDNQDTHSIQVGGAESGSNYYSTTDDTSHFASNELNQNFSDTPGEAYVFSYWMEDSGITGLPDLLADVTTGGGSVYGGDADTSEDHGWQEYSYDFVGTGSDAVNFSYSLTPGNTIGIDNVSVTPDVTPTPEPATPAVFACGAMLAAGCILYRRRAAVPSVSASA